MTADEARPLVVAGAARIVTAAARKANRDFFGILAVGAVELWLAADKPLTAEAIGYEFLFLVDHERLDQGDYGALVAVTECARTINRKRTREVFRQARWEELERERKSRFMHEVVGKRAVNRSIWDGD